MIMAYPGELAGVAFLLMRAHAALIVGRLAFEGQFTKFGNLPACRHERGPQGRLLIRRRRGNTAAIRRPVSTDERPMREADRGRHAPVCQARDGGVFVHDALSGKSAATKSTSAATAPSASSPDALI